ncbi:hypothetical protein HYDPIDRAFT_116492 [Hydnomerulius pinastri MD-312]|uniref:Major facilitator superfamily (MFS) profile domain-containing protein n=1 Tax=Hydnomerulius pinastri MD-312 TaxID=994086 RepID=A0A0C9WB88_9AGAM|nr:hypothetical protein HYDPIDRAFT_116492 [Hydnomerulius pinastri MD-312]
MAAGVVMCLPSLGLALAGLAGFSAMGPVAGTLAPWIQSTFYGAHTGGLFAGVQSLIMTVGHALPLLLGGIAVFSLGAVLRYYIAPRFRTRPHAD